MHNPNKLTKLTLDGVSCPRARRRPFKGMNISTLTLVLATSTSLTLPQTGADKVSGPMRKYGGTQLVQVKERQASLEDPDRMESHPRTDLFRALAERTR